VVLALLASLCYGVGDFMGGLATRRVSALLVVITSQLAGSVVLACLLPFSGQEFRLAPCLVSGAGGVLGGLALLLFYRGLAVGMMSIVAPVTACGAVIPVIVALAQGQVPPPITLGGMSLAFGGVILVSLAPSHGGQAESEKGNQSVLLALGAAIGFGLFFVFIGRAAHLASHSVLWIVLGGRVGSLSVLILLAVATSVPIRPQDMAHSYLLLSMAAGTLDTFANVFLALASTRGNLGVVGVLASLYPAFTVLLAGALLHERLRAFQAAGVATAMVGVVLVAAG
jgi:drug/metabolite transporter (DMT)-like permease